MLKNQFFGYGQQENTGTKTLLLSLLKAIKEMENKYKQIELASLEPLVDKYMEIYGDPAVNLERINRAQKAVELQETLDSDLMRLNVPYQKPNWRTLAEYNIELAKQSVVAPTSEILRDLEAPESIIKVIKNREDTELSKTKARRASLRG